MHMLWFFFLFHRFVFIILFACCCVQIIKQTNNNSNNNKPTKLNENPILRIHEQYSLSSFVIASYVHIHIFFAFFLLLWIYLRSLKSSKTLFFVALFFLFFCVLFCSLSLSLCVILITFRRIKEVNMKISEYVEWMWKKMAKTELLTNKNTTANDCNANKQFIIFSVRHKLNKKYCVYKLHKLIYCDPLKFCHFFFSFFIQHKFVLAFVGCFYFVSAFLPRLLFICKLIHTESSQVFIGFVVGAWWLCLCYYSIFFAFGTQKK